MERKPPLPQELWDRIPPDLQAALWVVVEGYEQRLAALAAEVVELKERLTQTAQNSSRPPSSDGPHVKRKPPRAPSGRKRGGQPGHEVLGVPRALGEVCQVEQTGAAALVAPVQEVRAYVQAQDATVDETSWRQQQHRAGLWVAVTRWVSVFLIRPSCGAQVLRELVGARYSAVLTSDRAKADNGQPLPERQICWAHLRRDFQAMIDRGGAGAAVGQRLVEQAEVLFGGWHWVRDGTWAWATFQGYMRWLRGSVQAELAAGARCPCPKTSATCQELLKVEAALWTFVRVPGLEPPNNAAERALRHVAHGQLRAVRCLLSAVREFYLYFISGAGLSLQSRRCLLRSGSRSGRLGSHGLAIRRFSRRTSWLVWKDAEGSVKEARVVYQHAPGG